MDAETKYLHSFRRGVEELSKGRASLSDLERSELESRMSALVPGGKLSFMVGLSVNPVAAELAAGSQRAKTA